VTVRSHCAIWQVFQDLRRETMDDIDKRNGLLSPPEKADMVRCASAWTLRATTNSL